MAKIKESFSVLGLSKFGYRTAVGLFEAGARVIAVDRDVHLVEKISQQVSLTVTADVMDWEVMDRFGVFDVDVVVIGFRKAFEAAVLLTHHMRKNTKVSRIIAQVDTYEKGEALRLMGVDTVIFPEQDIADRLVRRLTMPDLVEHIPLSPDTAIIETAVPEGFTGKTLAELDIRARYKVSVLGIRHPGGGEGAGEVIISPSATTRFQPGDMMLVLGRAEDLDRFARDNRKT